MQTTWWRIEAAPTPDEWSALLTGVTLLVAIVAAAIALGQLRAHFATERARSRPYVIVDFAFRSVLMQVEIKNIGATAASDIALRVDPPFESGLRDQAATLNAVFSEKESISMLAPGRRILYTFDRAPDYYEAKRPEKYTITATYTDLPALHHRPWRNGWRREVVRHSDTYTLDFRQWSQATSETDFDNMNWNIAKRQETRSERVANSLKVIADIVRQRSDEAVRQVVPGDVVQQDELRQTTAIHHPVDTSPGKPRRRPIKRSKASKEQPSGAAAPSTAPQVHNEGDAGTNDEAPEPATSA